MSTEKKTKLKLTAATENKLPLRQSIAPNNLIVHKNIVQEFCMVMFLSFSDPYRDMSNFLSEVFLVVSILLLAQVAGLNGNLTLLRTKILAQYSQLASF